MGSAVGKSCGPFLSVPGDFAEGSGFPSTVKDSGGFWKRLKRAKVGAATDVIDRG